MRAPRDLSILHDRWQASDPTIATQVRTARSFLAAGRARRGG